jgi:predicted nucleic acid-binding protein
MNNVSEKYYFDTCTVIDAINDRSPYHEGVNSALGQIKGDSVFSEYMEDELKRVLRKSEMFRSRMDDLLSKYVTLKQQLGAKLVENDTKVSNLERYSKRISRRVGIKQADIVHIGICGEKNIENIVSEDWHIHGKNKNGVPFISIVKTEFSMVYNTFFNPQNAFSTRQGFLKKTCIILYRRNSIR